MAEIRHLENRQDVIFFCRGLSDLNKISQTGAEWHVDCGDMVKIENRCRIPIWRTFGRIQWHVIPEPRITLQGAATWWIHCHDSRATCHIAGCNDSIRHIENRFSPNFIFFCFFLFFNAVWALTSSAFRMVSDTLVMSAKLKHVVRLYCLSVCLSVSRMTPNVISQFHWNLESLNCWWWCSPRYGFMITLHFPRHGIVE